MSTLLNHVKKKEWMRHYKVLPISSQNITLNIITSYLDLSCHCHLQSSPPRSSDPQSQHFYHERNASWNFLFWVNVFNTICSSTWIFSVKSNLCHFNLGKRKKFHGARLGKYRWWGITAMLFFTKDCCTMKAVCSLELCYGDGHTFLRHFPLICSLSRLTIAW